MSQGSGRSRSADDGDLPRTGKGAARSRATDVVGSERAVPERDVDGTQGDARRRPAVLVSDLRADLSSAIDGTPSWLTGAGAGLQAAVLSLVVVVVPVLAAYVAGSVDAQGSDGGWFAAAALGMDFWLLAHGVPLGTSAGTVTIVPLGLSALAVFCAFASARRSGTPSRAGLAAGVGAYVLCVIAVAALALPRGIDGGPTATRVLLTAALGGVVVGGLGLAAGVTVRADAPRLSVALAPLRRRVAREVWLGVGGGLAVVAGVVGLGGVVVVTWVLAGQAQIADIVASLQLDALSGIALAIAQLAFLPNLVAWAVAWLAGPGFAVGAGSHFATTGVLGTTLPAIPVLGALPSPESVTPVATYWPAAVVVLGGLVGLVLRRRLGDVGPARALGTVAAAVGMAGVVVALLVGAAGGAAGPGRMGQVGASGLVTGLAVGVAAGLGLFVVVVAANARVVGRVRRLASGAVVKVRHRVSR